MKVFLTYMLESNLVDLVKNSLMLAILGDETTIT